MKKIGLGLLAIVAFYAVTNAQQDPRAKAILDKLSAKTKQYKSISADFSYTMVNTADDVNEKQTGKLITKGNKYYLSLAGQEIFCDGTTLWTYIKESNEVQINNVPKDGEKSSNYVNPSSIFTIYNKGFKFQYKGEKKEGDKIYQVIDLYPMKPEDKNYHTIVLTIDKSKMQISSIEIKGKDGTNYTYIVKSFVSNKNLNDSEFSFNKAAHPKVEVTDLR